MFEKRIYKVISPMERRDGGGKWWQRCGSAYTNKDASINVYLDVIPNKPEFTLQLRELTEDELRERSTKRTSDSSHASTHTPHVAPVGTTEALPF